MHFPNDGEARTTWSTDEEQEDSGPTAGIISYRTLSFFPLKGRSIGQSFMGSVLSHLYKLVRLHNSEVGFLFRSRVAASNGRPAGTPLGDKNN